MASIEDRVANLNKALEGKVSANALFSAIHKMEPVQTNSSGSWLQAIRCLSSLTSQELDWITPEEQQSVRYSALGKISLLHTKFPPYPGPAFKDLREAIGPFLAWLVLQSDKSIVNFCWPLLKRTEPAESWNCKDTVVLLHHMGRLTGDFSLDNLRVAANFSSEANHLRDCQEQRFAMCDWNRDSQPFLEAFSHPSYLVRSNAAKALGSLFIGCTKHSPKPTASLAEQLTFLKSIEEKIPGVAGPFLDGTDWFFEQDPPLPKDFMRDWLLATLRASQRELFVPGCQSLEFYAHEYFSFDGDAIEQMVSMGRRSLAVFTATEDPVAIPRIQATLDRMASSSDSEVAKVIQTYLSVRFHHAGTEFITEPAFGL